MTNVEIRKHYAERYAELCRRPYSDLYDREMAAIRRILDALDALLASPTAETH